MISKEAGFRARSDFVILGIKAMRECYARVPSLGSLLTAA